MKKEYLFAGITVILWSTLSAISKLMIHDMSSMSVLFYTSSIASITLFLINIITKGTTFFKIYHVGDYLRIAGLGFLGLFCYTELYYIGLIYLTSQIACIINYMWPMMIILFSCIILKETLTVRKLLAITTSFLGMVVITIQNGLGGISFNSLLGMFACFFAAICYGIYSVFNKKTNYDQWIVLWIAFTVTALCSGFYCGITHTFGQLTSITFAGMLWLGIFVNAIAYVLWGLALNHGDTAKISILAYLCPFLSLIWGRILLGEHLSILSFVGLILIIGGVLFQMKE